MPASNAFTASFGAPAAVALTVTPAVSGTLWIFTGPTLPLPLAIAFMALTTSDVVGACEQVAEAALREHRRVATEAVATSGPGGNAGAGAVASVIRREGRLHVSVSGLDALAPRQRDAAIVRMVAKLREFDTSARGIDVSLLPAP